MIRTTAISVKVICVPMLHLGSHVHAYDFNADCYGTCNQHTTRLKAECALFTALVTYVCELQLSLPKMHEFGEVLHASYAISEGRSAPDSGVYLYVFQSMQTSILRSSLKYIYKRKQSSSAVNF